MLSSDQCGAASHYMKYFNILMHKGKKNENAKELKWQKIKNKEWQKQQEQQQKKMAREERRQNATYSQHLFPCLWRFLD